MFSNIIPESSLIINLSQKSSFSLHNSFKDGTACQVMKRFFTLLLIRIKTKCANTANHKTKENSQKTPSSNLTCGVDCKEICTCDANYEIFMRNGNLHYGRCTFKLKWKMNLSFKRSIYGANKRLQRDALN